MFTTKSLCSLSRKEGCTKVSETYFLINMSRDLILICICFICEQITWRNKYLLRCILIFPSPSPASFSDDMLRKTGFLMTSLWHHSPYPSLMQTAKKMKALKLKILPSSLWAGILLKPNFVLFLQSPGTQKHQFS